MSTADFRQKMSPDDLISLMKAKREMENIGLVMKTMNRIGGSIETGLKRIPSKQQQWLQSKVNETLLLLVKSNLATMQKGNAFKKPSSATYKALVTSTGALSGIFGSTTGLGTAIFTSELIISTKFIMRSIMDIARSEGEDLYDPETQMACLQVFALGGDSKDDDGLETSYYTSRYVMDAAVKNATSYIAKNGIGGLNKLLAGSSNPLLKLISSIASRFTVQVSEKFVAQAVPIIGAAGGGSINFMFIHHFQKMARAHFTIRRLERKYGQEAVKQKYIEVSVKE